VSALKICPTCGTEYPANERFCPKDGTALRAQGGAAGDLVGSIIAERYHVIRKLGEGGMGQVYLAEHVKMGRRSAVKVMHPGMVHDADAISRFNREASNASRINHPNVAGIYDFGETADGLIYLAMEYVEGEPLTALVEAAGPLPAARAAEITRQTGEALAVAHEMGIVHRDLKPDNIMIAKNRDGSDCVKVVDFGIAKAAGNEAQKVTRTGLVVGTPEYMSPEQLAGDPLDGRSDIYSLGLVAFHMLTGALPFPSETAQESMIMRLTERPRSLGEMKPDTSWPPEVQAAIDRALERDAKARFQSASEFGRRLSDAVKAMPESMEGTAGTTSMDAAAGAVPATRSSAAAPVRATRRGPMLIGGGLVAAALVAGAMMMPRGGTAGTSPAPARVAADSVAPAPAAPAGEARANAGPATRVVSADMAARLPSILARSGDSLTARQALAEADELLPRATKASDRVGLSLARAQALGYLGRDAESCRLLRSVQRSAEKTSYARKIGLLLDAGC
jgi:serine/threonine-protein kinase